jgi:hypothetical protein
VNKAILSNQLRKRTTYIMAEAAQVPAGDNLQAAQAVAVQPPAPDNPADKHVQPNAGGEDIT